MNNAINYLLSEARRHHRNCRDYRVYENYKRQFSQLSEGWVEYENAIAKLTEILGL